MPFKNYNELIDMADEDPKMARMKVSQAKQSGRPVVSNSNPGYRQAAISKRLAKTQQLPPGNNPGGYGNSKYKDSTKDKSNLRAAIKNRMQKKTDQANSDIKEDEIVAKRKRFGF